MVSQTIIADGIVYVRARNAARVAGISPDYVSRLARALPLDSRLVEGPWFDNITFLRQFPVRQKRQKELWHSRLAKMWREVQRRAGHPAAA